jgi:hypothetical protein
MEHKIIVRYSVPTKMDNAPYGTIYSVTDEGNDTKLYIQLSQDESSPIWQDLSFFFEMMFLCMLDDDNFMSKCLELYKMQSHGKGDILKMFKEL